MTIESQRSLLTIVDYDSPTVAKTGTGTLGRPMGNLSALFAVTQGQLPKLCALIVLTVAAGPGMCAIACDLDICPGCKVEVEKPSCCKEKAEKPKCCEENSPQVELTNHKSSPNYVLWVPILDAQSIWIEFKELDSFQPIVAKRERAPPPVPTRAKPSRAPPVC